MRRSSRTTPSLTTTQWLRSFNAPPRTFCLSPHSPLAFFRSFLVTKSYNSPKAYSSSPTGAGTSRTPLPEPDWKRSSQVGSAYQEITRPKPQRKDQEDYGKLRKLLRSPPPPSSPAFPEHIAEVQSVVNTLRSSDETKAKRKLHSSLVRGVQMKSTVACTLCPKDLEPLVVRDPATKELLSDPADVAKVYGDTLLHLGGHPDYAPPPMTSSKRSCPTRAYAPFLPRTTTYHL